MKEASKGITPRYTALHLIPRAEWRSSCLLKSHEILSVAVGDPFPVDGTDRELIEKIVSLYHRSVWIVGREHDSPNADLKKEIEERGHEIETTDRVVDVLPEVVACRTIQLCQFLGKLN